MPETTLKFILKDAVPDLKKVNRVIPRLMRRPKLQKAFFKSMTKIWSEDEDSRRILALLNMLKAVGIGPSCFGLCMKLMYIAYVRNSKFVLGSTVAHINFMRLSLIELFSKNLDEAYLHTFAYVRQLAISLRKAYQTRSKADTQAVQNWQFVNGLRLWTELIAKYSADHKLLSTLIHPVVQLLVGLIKLNPGERWIPLRFHCVQMLHTIAGVPTLIADPEQPAVSCPRQLTGFSLTSQNRILVPSLPLLLDTFQMINFNRSAVGLSKAPLDLRLMLHFSPSQSKETASLDAIISWLFDLLAEAAAIQATSLAFPEFVLPLINELKQFCSTCRVASFTRQMKALLAKLREHSDWIVVRRKRVRNLSNPNDISQLETNLSNSDDSAAGPPYLVFYTMHKQVRSKELARLTECHQKNESLPKVTSDKKEEDHRSGTSDSEDSDSGDSEASYDLDDGSEVTHVSKSKRAKPSAAEQADDSESDFDLEHALNEPEEDKSEFGSGCDELTEFEMSDSDAEMPAELECQLEQQLAKMETAVQKNRSKKVKSQGKRVPILSKSSVKKRLKVDSRNKKRKSTKHNI